MNATGCCAAPLGEVTGAKLATSLALGLEANGYRTLHAANAAIGWELARAHLPDLILSDIDMPGKAVASGAKRGAATSATG